MHGVSTRQVRSQEYRHRASGQHGNTVIQLTSRGSS
jgi:hypothetical protein